MPFGEENWNRLLPSYLTEANKGRLKLALDQFKPRNRNEISYDQFYKQFDHNYFLQGDLVIEVRTSDWDSKEHVYNKVYTNAIILSNTCDLSFENKRELNPKQCLFAPLIDLDDFIQDLVEAGFTQEQAQEFKKTVKAQVHSNIFYLPALTGKAREQIALLDHIFWYPIEELKLLIETISEDRLASLDHFGYYLFILKLSYHLCRLPEQCDREIA